VSKFLHYSLAEPENVENEEVVKIEEPLSLISVRFLILKKKKIMFK
jgi:hypothetical protein